MSVPLFILSSGRSGSTLVQRVLNSYDTVTIWGEHRGFLKDVAAAYYGILENPANRQYFTSLWRDATPEWEEVLAWKRSEEWQAWMNWVTTRDVDTHFRDFARRFFRHPSGRDEGHVWGFKEIRYGAGDRVIDFLAHLFPDARFVFLARNGLNTVTSQLRTFHSTGTRFQGVKDLVRLPLLVQRSDAWRVQNATLHDWHRSGRLRSTWIAYEDLARDAAQALGPLLEELGLQFGEAQQAVVADRGEGRGTQFASDDVNARWRTVGLVPMACAEMVLGDVNRQLGYDTPAALRWARHFRWLAPLFGAGRRGSAAIS